MCGRYAASADPDALVEDFEIELDATLERSRSLLKSPQQPPAGTPDHNMAPSKQAPAVLCRAVRPTSDSAAEPIRQLRLLTWGLVPSWSTKPGGAARMINARAETLLDTPAYRKAAANRRCLLPAQGWFEWQSSPVAQDPRGRPRTQPFFISRQDGATVAMAGLYEFWRDQAIPQEDPTAWVVSFAVVTTDAEPGLDRIHDRQPMVLERDRWHDWLDPSLTAPAAVSELLSPTGPGRFQAWPVSRAVNSPRHNGPELLRPLPTSELVGVLDPSTGEVLGG